MKARLGRRRGGNNTRDAIIATAQRLFGERSFDAVSLREIARQAEVDPAMVHHYFASKEALFDACVELPANPEKVLAVVTQTVPEERAEVLLRTILTLWDSPAQPAFVALLRTVVGSSSQGLLIRRVLFRRVIAGATAGLDGPPAEIELRGSLLASQLVGIMLLRYILKAEPLAQASHDHLVALYSPTLQGYLTGPLPQGGS